MSFQIAILKILSGQPEGRASLVELKKYLAIFTTSGPDWTERMKRLSARAPNLDIFSSRFVVRDEAGWQITEAGRAFLESIETPAEAPAEAAEVPAYAQSSSSPSPAHLLLVGPKRRKRKRQGRRRASDRTRRSA